MLEQQTLAGDFDFGVQVASEFQRMPCPFLVLYLERRSDVGNRGGLVWIDVLLQFFADAEEITRVINLQLDALLEGFDEVVEGRGQLLHVGEGVLRVQLGNERSTLK